MDIRLVKLIDIGKHDELAWKELVSRSLEPNPFVEPDFLLLCACHIASYKRTVVVIAHEGDVFRGVFPIISWERPRIPPRIVATTGARPRVGRLLDTPLVDSGCADQAVGAIVDALRRAVKDRSWPGILAMDMVGMDGPVAASVSRVCVARGLPMFVREPWERATVSRAGSWANPLDGDRRREINRRQRLLAADVGAEVTLMNRTLDPTVSDDFLTMEMSGWKGGPGGQALGSAPETTAWFKEWHHQWAVDGRLTVLALQVGQTTVAMQYFVRAGDGLFCFRMTYDETFAKYKPGAMLLSLSLNYLRDNTDAAWFDSTSDKDDEFFLGMLPERRTMARLVIGIGGVLDRSMVSVLPAATKTVVRGRQARDWWRRCLGT